MSKIKLVWRCLIGSFLLIYFPGLSQSPLTILQEGIKKYQIGEYNASIELFLACMPLAEEAEDFETLQSIFTNLGNAYGITGNVELALSYYHKGIDLAERTKDSVRLAKILKNIGVLYEEQKDFPTALSYYEKAEALAVVLNSEEIIADCATNRAVVYEQMQRYDEALALYDKALALYDALDMDERRALTYNNIGIVYKQLGQLDQTLVYYQKTLDIATNIGDKYIIAAVITNMANVYILQKKYDEAIKMNEQGMQIARSINAPNIIIEIYGNLSDIYASAGDFENAFRFAKRYKVSNDSLISLERSAQLAEMREKYETEKKEAENLALKQEAALKSFQLQEQALILQNRNMLLIGSLSFIILFTITAYLFFLWQKSRNDQLRLEAIRLTEEQERMRIARDLHDDLGAGLSKIKLLSNVASSKSAYAPIQKEIQALSATASDLVGNMRDMVWALNPENTTLDYLVARIREYAHEYLEDFPIDLVLNTPREIPMMNITKEANRNIFFAIKECLQNMVRHSEATAANLSVTIADAILKVNLIDNGKGYGYSMKRGNGMSNIENRMGSVGGRATFQSGKGTGVKVELTIPLDQIKA